MAEVEKALTLALALGGLDKKLTKDAVAIYNKWQEFVQDVWGKKKIKERAGIITMRNNMISIETIKLLKAIEELCELSKAGFKPFSECNEENKGQYIFYDERKVNPDGSFKICLDVLVIEDHHDVISYYEDYAGDYRPISDYCTIGVLIDEEGPYVTIKLEDNNEIYIMEGQWDII